MTKVLISCEPDDQIGADLLSSFEDVEVLRYDPNESVLTEAQRQAEILVVSFRGSHRPIPLVSQLPHLKMTQLLSAGTDEWAPHVPPDVVLASARGGHAHSVSEWVLSAVLCLYRGWPALLDYQREGIWAHRKVAPDTVAGKRVLVIGAGHIGTASAERLRKLDAATTLVASTARGGVHGADDIPNLIADHDIVVIAAPLTPDTRGLVDQKFLATMSDGALLINVGRGEIVDTDALIPELRNERLRAALDVTAPEPLPPGHPLFSCPGVIISPHMSKNVPGTAKRCYEVAVQQVKTFLDGGVPSNIELRR
ncbi:NAD(P)-dependent oxidoreductase [Amycolatopsis sp. NPDC102389]|uniref:NAD(P)-dependent oxidoreductase n=1 Tax=Amycolatopsis sp. NPDC102389 TaxID=3363941 RepID=UPI003806373A